MESVRCGDLFIIPYDGKEAVAKLIWLSERIPNCIGFVLLSPERQFMANTEFGEDYHQIEMNGDFVTVLYSDLCYLQQGDWRVIGHLPLTDLDQHLLHHLVDDDLYEGDQFQAHIAVDQLHRYPAVEPQNVQALEKWLSEAFEGF
ncbi:hypothetical protein VST7929_01298 [Vibrio stylophorae]|uniref:Uncharacterized protein n=1 Tax=Vibrio stylophorae TaxID=659351 RepID=A0ABM8ZSY9_9VIBR|nr:hypothetical protein [Vibrio stylophorae]CAH0533430.1 hypothetical protein VST7929_01298 [Vibrio stylophorae]